VRPRGGASGTGALPALLIVFDASQRVVEDSLHAELAFSAHVDDFAQALDEEIHTVRLELPRRKRVFDL
jgi:hypothetical protein